MILRGVNKQIIFEEKEDFFILKVYLKDTGRRMILGYFRCA